MNTKTTSRRRFFTQGGAALGAGAVATAAGSASSADDPMKRLREIEDREAIRQLHLAFTHLIEKGALDTAEALFDDPAVGRRAIAEQLAFHRTYRQGSSQRSDTISLAADRIHASATFHIEVEWCTPLRDDCTAATMARLQGNVADRRWESGRFDAQYVKTRGEWKVASLVYRPA